MIVGVFNLIKPLPEGYSYESQIKVTAQARLRESILQPTQSRIDAAIRILRHRHVVRITQYVVV